MDINQFLWFDKPIPYKGLVLNPVRVKDYLSFIFFAQCFRLDKNSIPDIKIIQMTELEYLFTATLRDTDIPALFMFDRLLSLCLDDESFSDMRVSIERYKITNEGKYVFTIGEHDYDSDDFLEIRRIIAEQNDFELINPNISKEVRDAFEKARAFKSRNKKSGTFEDYIISLAVATGWEFDYIYELPIRKFNHALKRYDNLLHYKIYLSASMSGMVDFKDKSFIQHWLSDLSSGDEYSDVSTNLEDIQSKISFDAAKNAEKQRLTN